MQCQQCGYDNAPSTSYCTNCGAPLSGWQNVEPDNFSQPINLNEGNFENSYQPAEDFQNAPPFNENQVPPENSAWNPPSDNAWNQPNQAPQNFTTAASMTEWIKWGFNDIKNGIGLLKAALLSLLQLIPVVGFFFQGAVIRSGADTFEGNARQPLSNIFEAESIIMFFRMFAFTFLFNVVISIGMFVLMLIPILGWIATVIVPILAAIAIVPYEYIASIRSARLRNMSPFFDFKGNFEIAKRDIGGILFTSFVPTLAIGLIAAILGGIVTSILGLGIGAAGNAYSASGSTAALTGVGIGTVFGLLILAAIVTALGGVTSLVVYRSIGYWMNVNAPDFLAEQPQPRPQPTYQQPQQQPQQQSSQYNPADGQTYYVPPQYYQAPQPQQPQQSTYQSQQQEQYQQPPQDGSSGYWNNQQ